MKLHIAVPVLFVGLIVLPAVCGTGQVLGISDLQRQEETDLTNAAGLLVKSNKTLAASTVREQLRRWSCRLELSKPTGAKLTARQVRERARASYLQVGWFYLCNHCDQWRLSLGGGYLLTKDGAVGTAYHVVDPPRDLREGGLIAADDAGKVFPVTEILAGNRYSDACILRVKGDHFVPLPLSTNVSPGDTVYCLSDPVGRRRFFSQGIVNRFFTLPARRLPYAPGAPLFAPTRMNVSTDWSFGSSGAAVLDESGNVVGHVSTISVEENGEAHNDSVPASPPETIVFHEAVSAQDVLALVKPIK